MCVNVHMKCPCVVAKVNVGRPCLLSEECLDEFARCERGTCTCQSQYFYQNNHCGRHTSVTLMLKYLK